MPTTIAGRLNTLMLALLVLMAAAIIGVLATRAGAGPLDPGAPASTMYNVIFRPSSCAGFPVVISASGSFQLGSDITGCSGKDGIEIATSNVTIDLNGHNRSGGGEWQLDTGGWTSADVPASSI